MEHQHIRNESDPGAERRAVENRRRPDWFQTAKFDRPDSKAARAAIATADAATLSLREHRKVSVSEITQK